MEQRMNKDQYYLSIAQTISERSTCLTKHWGAVIVSNDEIVSTGYNGAPRGRRNCCEMGFCQRRGNGTVERGTNYSMCRAVHAEQNAIISASRERMLHGKIYVYGFDCVEGHIVDNPNSCSFCKMFIINAGIDEAIFAEALPDGVEDPLFRFRPKIVKVKQDWIDNDDSIKSNGGY